MSLKLGSVIQSICPSDDDVPPPSFRNCKFLVVEVESLLVFFSSTFNLWGKWRMGLISDNVDPSWRIGGAGVSWQQDWHSLQVSSCYLAIFLWNSQIYIYLSIPNIHGFTMHVSAYQINWRILAYQRAAAVKASKVKSRPCAAREWKSLRWHFGKQ